MDNATQQTKPKLQDTESTRSRRSGRPGPEASDDHRHQLLEAAERLFSKQGYSGTSLREIADTAGVNAALVNYYFGNKEGLMRAVFDRALQPLAEAVAELAQAPEARPDQLLAILFSISQRHPALLPLLAREALLPGGMLNETFARDYAPRLGGMFPGLIAREQEQGRLDPDADPQCLTLLILAMGIFPFIASNMAEKALGLTLDNSGRERLHEQILRLLDHGVRRSTESFQ